MSVLTKRATNSVKTGQFILNSQIYAQRVLRGSTDAPEMHGSQGHRERLRITAPSENSVDILVLFPQRTQRITGSAFRISFNLDWLMDNDIFNRPIMARTQLNHWYTGGDSEQRFRRCFADGLNQSEVSGCSR